MLGALFSDQNAKPIELLVKATNHGQLTAYSQPQNPLAIEISGKLDVPMFVVMKIFQCMRNLSQAKNGLSNHIAICPAMIDQIIPIVKNHELVGLGRNAPKLSPVVDRNVQNANSSGN